jgi:hypothetical protein
MNIRTFIIALLASVLLSFAPKALAADFTHQVCIGLITLDTGDSLKSIEKLVLVYDDHRSGADKRKITVSLVHNGKTYSGFEITASSVAHVKVANVADRKDILFDGTVEGLEGAKGIEIIGNYTVATGKVQPIKATLESADIPQ